jgi:beta-lactam-binding protein with PASTA domain
MCFATMSLAGSLVASAVTAGGTLESGIAASRSQDYAAQVAANNSLVAQQNASYAEKAGSVAATTQALKGAAQGGAVKAAQAASGTSVNTGSNVDVQVSQRDAAKESTQTVMSNAELQSYGYRSQATGFQAQSELDKAAASQDVTGAEIGAAGNLLGGASGTAFKWAQTQNGPEMSDEAQDAAQDAEEE